MNLTALMDTPRLYTALAEWGALSGIYLPPAPKNIPLETVVFFGRKPDCFCCLS